MTENKSLWDAVEKYKYAIMYYVYFASCLVVALWLAKPMEILASLV
ncbi:MAG: hypothetical protein ACOC1V_01105 [Candidatus Saliniplasma sp.]